MGLIIPEKGYIKVDKDFIFKEGKYKNLNNWQYSISHVPQNVYLLDTSIRKYYL